MSQCSSILRAQVTDFALVDTRHEYDHLFSIYVPIAIGVFVVIVLAIVFAVVRYRAARPSRPLAGTRTTGSRARTPSLLALRGRRSCCT